MDTGTGDGWMQKIGIRGHDKSYKSTTQQGNIYACFYEYNTFKKKKL